MSNTETGKNRFTRREFLFLTFGTGLGVVIGAELETLESFPEEINPQGYWEKLELKGTMLHVEITAYSNNQHAAIQQVQLTILGKDGNWHRLADANIATRTNTFVFDVNVQEFTVPKMPFKISFDVINTTGQVSRAPNGEKVLVVN